MNKYSLIDILSREIILETENEKKTYHFEGIQIPMIQRDYAQGRKQESEVRNRFLRAIFNALIFNHELELDFVYGSVKVIDKKKYFTPIDGQQRLTTLFLLEYYISGREMEDENYLDKLEFLKKFSYATRQSAKDFCEKLCSTKLNYLKPPSVQIEKCSWYQTRFKNDPTVKSMLSMLDAIHVKYEANKNEHQFESLISGLNNLKFYVLPLDGFNLSDELYIKMNARGMQLTDFENFKADLIKWMKDPDNNAYHIELEYNQRKMPYFLSISEKIDNSWTNFLWEFTKGLNPDEKDKSGALVHPHGKLIDPLFMLLINRYFLNNFILERIRSNSDLKSLEKTDDYQYFYAENTYKNFDYYALLLERNNSLLSSFEKFTDALVSNWNSIISLISPSWMPSKNWNFLDYEITQKERVIFLGITTFLEKLDYNERYFEQWMRVVWNIVENTDIPDAGAMISAMKLIVELSDQAHAINTFLAQGGSLSADSSKIAVAEERLKARYIENENSWESIFIEAEAHPFFRGSIGFMITSNMTKPEFENRLKLASLVFDSKGVNSSYRQDGHIFLRALISRYTTSADLIGQNFIDVDESEHYLKKMLASNPIVKGALIEWFSLADQIDLDNKLKEEVSKYSTISGWSFNNEFEQVRIRRAHHALYRDPDFMDWMQKEKAIRFSWSNNHLYVSRPRSWYTWIMLETNRNNAITNLLTCGFETNHQIKLERNGNILPLNYYWCNTLIELQGSFMNHLLKITIHNNDNLIVDLMVMNEWRKVYSLSFLDRDLLFELTNSEFIINGHNIAEDIKNCLEQEFKVSKLSTHEQI